MLQKLYIRNYALIDELTVDWSEQLTMITGETGAGKSILLGALSLILGKRTASNVLHDDSIKCIVEGSFDVSSYSLLPFFEEHELDYDPLTIIRREITPSGKSRAFINDTPISLQILKQFAENLVNLHAQHQTLFLQDRQFQLSLIDALANHQSLLLKYKADFKTFSSKTRALSKLKSDHQKQQNEEDYKSYLLKELEEADLTNEDEQEELESELKQLQHAEKILFALNSCSHGLGGNEQSIISQLRSLQNFISEISSLHPAYQKLSDQFESCALELEDMQSEAEGLKDDVSIDPERLSIVEDRLNLIFKLQTKHKEKTLLGLIKLHENLAQELDQQNARSGNIVQLEKEIEQLGAALLKQAQKISKNRKAQLSKFEGNIHELLTEVGMPNAYIQANLQANENMQLSSDGLETMQLLFSANKGSQFQELKKVASGGELSRLMLCIQSLLAEHTHLPTLIFDEIDTGISGEVALRVGNLMQKLAKKHQVICITHLPQIASKGTKHFFVYKEIDTKKDKTNTRVRELKPDERVIELAKMLSGDAPGEMALANAKELLLS